MRRTGRIAATAVGITVISAGLAAAPAPANALANPYLEVIVYHITGGFKACAMATADAPPLAVSRWELDVTGWRSNGTVIDQWAADQWTSTFGTTTNPICLTVLKDGTTEGAFTATLSYISDSTDLAAAVVGTGTWDPVLGDKATSHCTGCA